MPLFGNKNNSVGGIPGKVRHFLVPEKREEELFKDVQEYTNYATYDLSATQIGGRSTLSALRDIPAMLEDAICSSALKCVMQTAFQTDNDDRVFTTRTKYSLIKNELDKFHEQINADNFILLTGYNNLLWGQLPWKHCYNKDGILERVIPIPDFTSVTPIIISGHTVGFLDEEKNFVPSYLYTYSQLSYYKNLGGNSNSRYITMGTNGVTSTEFKNEFTYADSYLSAASKAWRNVNTIEDGLMLNRMDQSNYYRIISVNVGGQVYSKSAIQVLNYYRNLFKKVRRVNYDSSGMSSRGNNQNFEVIVPQTQNQGVNIQNVGGDVDVKALKDLDTQYQKLFAALQIQPSMIGFSDDTPSSLGEGPATAWDKRFAKVCKTVSFAAFNALKRIDWLHLRSLGYDVSLSDWSYGTVSQTIQEDADKGETLKLAVENLKSISETLNSMQADYDKDYLVKSLLGGALSSFGVDIEQVMTAEKKSENEMTAVTASFNHEQKRNWFIGDCMSRNVNAMVLAGVLDQKSATDILSAYSTNDKVLIASENVKPLMLKDIKSSVGLRKTDEIGLTGYVNHCEPDFEETKFKELNSGTAMPFKFPVYTNVMEPITAGEFDNLSSRAISKIIVDKDGNYFIGSRTDLLTYLYTFMNGSLDTYCSSVWRTNESIFASLAGAGDIDGPTKAIRSSARRNKSTEKRDDGGLF